ncbi:hypothetical protein HNY73_013633 [Argiope bruennichi]|uniref:Uncharacterized protein n=1 Tax=Argiope bruennichi TaxID=94029 RepID=A0A8T0EYT3_ARGBR|nr:hypothetical protein HNY73_013633 [Argiope bruennichi]
MRLCSVEVNICVQDILPTRFMPIPSKFKVYIIDRVENRMEILTAFIRKTIFSSNAIQNELCRDAVKSDIDPERIRGHPPKLKDFCTIRAVMDDALVLHQSAHFMRGKSNRELPEWLLPINMRDDSLCCFLEHTMHPRIWTMLSALENVFYESTPEVTAQSISSKSVIF